MRSTMRRLMMIGLTLLPSCTPAYAQAADPLARPAGGQGLLPHVVKHPVIAIARHP